MPLLRRYPIALEFLKGVNAAVIALLIGVFINLAWSTLARPAQSFDWLTLALTGVAFVALERYKLDPARLVLVGAVVGLGRVALGV